jgi:5-methylcytosine-specific restriction enzyme A
MPKRKMPNTGWVDHNKLPKGPNGKALCRMCGKEVQGKRRTFCSELCVHQYKLRNQPGYVRGQLYKRDRGKCCICGVDTYKVRREFIRERDECKKGTLKETQECIKQVEQKYREAGWAPLHNRKWFNADHILPVAEGGGPNDWSKDQDYLCNFRTLCVPCHKKETNELRKRLKRRKENE